MNTNLILENINKHIQLSEREVEIFTSKLIIKKYKKKQFIHQAGDICMNQFFINKGCLRSYYLNKKGGEYIIQFAPENWWLADMSSFITQKPGMLYIDALENSEVILIDKNATEELYEKIPKLERYFRLLLQNAFVSMQKRILSGMSKTAEERYQEFRLKFPQLENRLPQIQIAAFLGITPEFLSKIKKNI